MLPFTLFFTRDIFISLRTVPSILLLFVDVFSAHVCKLRMLNVVTWVEYSCHMVSQVLANCFCCEHITLFL